MKTKTKRRPAPPEPTELSGWSVTLKDGTTFTRDATSLKTLKGWLREAGYYRKGTTGDVRSIAALKGASGLPAV